MAVKKAVLVGNAAEIKQILVAVAEDLAAVWVAAVRKPQKISKDGNDENVFT
jgi:hypothetical protein